METFSALLAICVGNSPVTSECPTQSPVTRSFEVLFDLRFRAHYDVIVMTYSQIRCAGTQWSRNRRVGFQLCHGQHWMED